MLANIFNRQINSITIAAGLVAVFSLASRFLGIIRDRILAGEFGAGATLDIYYAAFRVPDLIFNLVVLGALSAGFIPVFTSLLKNKEDSQAAWTLANNVLNYLLLGVGLLSLVGIIAAPALVRLIAPGFSSADQSLVVSLSRIMFLSPLFLGISGVFGGVLQSFKRFLVYSLAPIFYNLGIIIGALYFVDLWGVSGLAWGVVLGAILHMAVQIPTIYQLGFRYHWWIKTADQNTKKIGRLMIPRTLSLAVAQINLVVITAIASGLESGSLAVFNFANNLQSFPVGIFGISFAIAAFPALSAAAFDREALQANFSRTLRQIFFFIIPATVFIIALRAQIIRVVLGTGNFSWQDTILTMNTLGFFALSLFAQAALPLLNRMFYARHNSATPLYIGLVAVLANIVLALVLAPKLGVGGLALAFSLASILNFLLLWVWLSFSLGSLDIGNILNSVLKFTAAAILAGSVIQLVKLAVWPFIDMSRFSGVFIQLGASLLAGSLIYLGVCYVLRSEELAGFLAALKQRLPGGKLKIGDQGEARGL